MPRLAANLAYLFTERPLLERFGAAAAAGFTAVELQFPYDHAPSHVRAEIERYGLIMLGINTPQGRAPGGESGVAAMPGREAEFAALFRQALEYAVAIGSPQIICMAGIVPPDLRPAAQAAFIRNLTAAADLAREKNVTLLIEPINPLDRPDYFLNRCEHAAAVIAEVGRPNLRLQFDFYHAQILGGDLIRRFEKHLPIVGHVQIAGVPSRCEPDEGEVHYPAIFSALDSLGYRGFVGAEIAPRGKTEEGLGWGQAYGLIAAKR